MKPQRVPGRTETRSSRLPVMHQAPGRLWRMRADRLLVVMPSIEHRQHKGLNNRAENSHQPTRRRERQMKQFKSAGQAQRFLSAHDQINNLFHLRREHATASERRASRSEKFQIWAEVYSVGQR